MRFCEKPSTKGANPAEVCSAWFLLNKRSRQPPHTHTHSDRSLLCAASFFHRGNFFFRERYGLLGGAHFEQKFTCSEKGGSCFDLLNLPPSRSADRGHQPCVHYFTPHVNGAGDPTWYHPTLSERRPISHPVMNTPPSQGQGFESIFGAKEGRTPKPISVSSLKLIKSCEKCEEFLMLYLIDLTRNTRIQL